MFEASGCCDKSLVGLDGVSTLSKQNQLNIHLLWWLEVVSVLVLSFLFLFCFLFTRTVSKMFAFCCRQNCTPVRQKKSHILCFCQCLLSTYLAKTADKFVYKCRSPMFAAVMGVVVCVRECLANARKKRKKMTLSLDMTHAGFFLSFSLFTH